LENNQWRGSIAIGFYLGAANNGADWVCAIGAPLKLG
jgi:hypothetical protein